MIPRAAQLPIVATMLVATFASTSRADEDPEYVEARKRMVEGKALYGQYKFEEARIKYVQACAVMHTPKCIRGLASAEYRAGKLLDAYRHFKEITDDPKEVSQWDAPTREYVMKFMADAYKQTGHIEITAPAEARIAVDGAAVGESPLRAPVDVMPGEHEVEAKIGTPPREVRARVNAVAGQIVAVKLEAEAAPTPAPAVIAPAATAVPNTVQPTPASTATSDTPPTSYWSTRRVVGAGVAGAGVLMLGAGVIFGANARSDADHASQVAATIPQGGCNGAAFSSACADLNQASDSQSRNHTLNVVFVGVGALAIGVGAALVLWPSSKPSTTSVALIPTFSPSGGGLQVRGDL